MTMRVTLLCGFLIAVGTPPATYGSPGSTIIRALTRYAGKEGVGESAEAVSKQIPQAVAERIGVKIVKEGGEESLERIAELSAKHGPEVVLAIDNAPSIAPILKALDELPADEVTKAAGRLAAGSQGRELAELTAQYGSAALRAEVVHPGVGRRFVQALGGDGASLSVTLTPSQAINLGRYVDDVAKLPPQQREGLLQVMRGETERFGKFLARFAENNPGKTLFTASGTTIFLANSERILGGDDVFIDAAGKPYVVSKPGLLGRGAAAAGDSMVSLIMRLVLWIGAPALGLYAAIKIWGVWRRECRRTST
jgi:hypothetical protein